MSGHAWTFAKNMESGHTVSVCECGAEKTETVDGRLVHYVKGEKCQHLNRGRRVLADIPGYLSALELLEKLEAPGWPYRIDVEGYQRRDKALVALLYLAALRVSEALRIKKSQLYVDEDRIRVTGILLSKLRRKERARKTRYREAWLPLTGERARFTQIILAHTDPLAEDAKLFPIGRTRAWQIVHALTGEWCHYFRGMGEDYLYDHWDYDLLAVSDLVKVNPSILIEYIRGRYKKHKPV